MTLERGRRIGPYQVLAPLGAGGMGEVGVRPTPVLAATSRSSCFLPPSPPIRIASPASFQALDGSLMVAAYDGRTDTFRAEKPRPWSSVRVSVSGPYRNFDLHPDGRRSAVLEPVDASVDERTDHVVLVQNFFAELRRLAPAAAR